MSANSFRLPRHTAPSHYDIHLDLDMDTFTFDGFVEIQIEVSQPISELVLNSAEITISEAHLGGVAISGFSYDEEFDRVTLNLAEEAPAGEHTLSIRYRGIINDQLRGLYRATFKDAHGVEHAFATSQCQATDARRIFPGWDEPDFKATFTTTMVVPTGFEAYSNSREVGRTVSGDRTEFRFAPTMKMSTYLLAFLAGPLEATEPVDVRGTPVRIIVPKGNLHLTKVALDNAVFCFEFLSDYYGIPYPGDKLDHAAIPDFAAGAMENVGLITYRETLLIIDEEKASQAELQNSLDVIGHEIAHQWFGNLVTMAWWEGAWLNEAFATFMEMKATAAKRPEWKRWLAFANTEVPWAMNTDHLASTRPIEFEVNAPEEVDQMFDAITYGKGSAVLHMIDEFIGVENFRTGVGNYLRKHQYANTVTGDLWEGLDGASEWPVSEIMNTWVYQRGFPQIDVSPVSGGVRLSQRRYFALPDETDTTIWKVPVQLRGSVDGKPFQARILLSADEETVAIDGNIDWMVGNGGGHGFYRTNYSPDLFDALLKNIDQLGEIERYTLLSDTMAFVRNGQLSADAFLDLASRFADESEQAIWSVITGGLALLEHHALNDDARPGFQRFVRNLVGPALTRMGWEPAGDDSDLTRKLRGELISALGVLGEDAETIDQSRKVVASVLEGGSVDPEVATAALSVFARHAGADGYATLWNAYLGASTPLDQRRYLQATARVSVPELALTTLGKVVSGEIRNQDSFWVFAFLLGGKSGPQVWDQATSQWSELLDRMPGMTRMRVVEGIPALSQPEVASRVRAFLAEHPIPEATRPVEQNLEKLEANVSLRERETGVVSEYFA